MTLPKSSTTSTESIHYIDGGQLLRSWHEQKNVVQVYVDSGRSTSEFGINVTATGGRSAPLQACECPGDLSDQFLAVPDASAEASAAQRTDLDLHHVEPAGALWRVMELEASKYARGFRRRKRFIQRLGGASRQVVHCHADEIRLRIVNIDWFAHALSKSSRERSARSIA